MQETIFVVMCQNRAPRTGAFAWEAWRDRGIAGRREKELSTANPNADFWTLKTKLEG